jgi:hypothetical protein
MDFMAHRYYLEWFKFFTEISNREIGRIMNTNTKEIVKQVTIISASVILIGFGIFIMAITPNGNNNVFGIGLTLSMLGFLILMTKYGNREVF